MAEYFQSPLLSVSGYGRRNTTFREEDTNNKTRMYVYTENLLATPLHVPVLQMPLDSDNGLPGVVLWIGITNNDDTIIFLAHFDTCAAMNTGNPSLDKYIMTKYPSLVAKFIQYDNADPFDPIILQCTVADLVNS